MKDKILVVKYGSSSLSGSNGIDITKISEYARKINELNNDYQIVIVSSGAVVAGKAIIGNGGSSDATINAMVGSAALVVAWQDAFKEYGIKAGQILVTHNDIADKLDGSRLRTVIHDVLNAGIIPIINENDVLSDIELAKITYGGDNDGLASNIAITISATELLLLTNVDGLLDEDGNVVREISLDDLEKVASLAVGKSDVGRGGMLSKIEAAILADKAGILAHIGSAGADYRSLLDGRLGTHIK